MCQLGRGRNQEKQRLVSGFMQASGRNKVAVYGGLDSSCMGNMLGSREQEVQGAGGSRLVRKASLWSKGLVRGVTARIRES